MVVDLAHVVRLFQGASENGCLHPIAPILSNMRNLHVPQVEAQAPGFFKL
jgi:hypothetical protein